MTRTALALLLAAAPVAAQPPLPVPAPPFRGGFGGVNQERFYTSNIALAAAQVVTAVESVRYEISRGAAPFPVKFELSRLADTAVREATNVRQLATTGADRQRLLAADAATDRAIETLLAAVNGRVVPTAALADAISRAQYADAHLSTAIAARPGPGVRPLGRLAQALADQTQQLRVTADQVLAPGVPADAQLIRSIRAFSFRIDRIHRALDDGEPAAKLVQPLDEAVRVWNGVAPPLAAAVTANPTLRRQAAQVDALFAAFGTRLRAEAGVVPRPPVGPVPPIGFFGRGGVAVGAGAGGPPRVRVFADLRGTPVADFLAFDPAFRGGVRVAVADLDGDSFPDLICAPGPGMPPLVRVFDGRTLHLRTEFLAYEPSDTGGVHVAAADRSRLGRSVVVTGTDLGGPPVVKMFDMNTGREEASFLAFEETFRGGVRVAVGDANGDGNPDVVAAAGPGGGPIVRVYDGRTKQKLTDFFAFDPGDRAGLWVAAADLNKNGRADLIVGTDANGPRVVRSFDPLRGTAIGDVFPFDQFAGGCRVAAHDVDNDGIPDVFCAPGPGAALPVRVFSGATRKPLGQFLPFEPGYTGGAFVGGR